MKSIRNKRTRRTRQVRGTGLSSLKQQVSRLNKAMTGAPFPVLTPRLPPPISLDSTVTKTVEVLIYAGQTGLQEKNYWLYGNASTPAAYFSEPSSLPIRYGKSGSSGKTYTGTVDFQDLVLLLESRLHRSAAASDSTDTYCNQDPLHLFSQMIGKGIYVGFNTRNSCSRPTYRTLC